MGPALVLLNLAGTGGCTLPPVDPDPSAPGTAPVSRLWARSDLRPVGQPLAVGGVAVAAIHDGADLFVVALEPSTGRELWRRPASPGNVVPGVAVGPTTAGGKVVYFRPDPAGDLFARLVIAEPRTGKDLATTAPLQFNSTPRVCDDGVDVCTVSRAGPDAAYGAFRLKVASGEYAPMDTGLPPQARLIGTGGLIDVGGRDPEELGRLRDGKLVWRRPLREAFPAGFSSSNGWAWLHYPTAGVFVGSVLGKSVDGTDNPAATTASAGLDEDTGTVLWQDPGSNVGCYGTLFGILDPHDPQRQVLALRCRGTTQGVTVERFDVRTGATKWAVPIGAAPSLQRGGDRATAVAGPAMLSIVAGAVLDVATGTHRPARLDERFWCRRPYTFDYREPYRYPDGQQTHTRHGTTAFACDGSWTPAATGLPSGAATTAVGARIGQQAVVATDIGFAGYRIS